MKTDKNQVEFKITPQLLRDMADQQEKIERRMGIVSPREAVLIAELRKCKNVLESVDESFGRCQDDAVSEIMQECLSSITKILNEGE